jgi:alpha-amylase
MNELLMDLIKEYGSNFKVSFSISGSAIDQFEKYAPNVLASFKKLADTGSVEFLAETYGHSLSGQKSMVEFTNQVNAHAKKIKKIFGQKPVTFRNTELIYSDEIGAAVSKMGYKTMLTEGAKHILAWRSPNMLYANAIDPELRLLLRNYQLSDDLAFRFSEQSWSEWPLTTEKFCNWLNEFGEEDEVVNIFMDYETFGEHQREETGIFNFMEQLPAKVFEMTDFGFETPSEVADRLQPVSYLNVPYPISWADEERDLSAWLGNDLQDEAFNKLYELEEKVNSLDNPELYKKWLFLQSSDHFYYMCTKWFSDGVVHRYFNPYNSPYDAFINYMNVLSDFQIQVNRALSNKTAAVGSTPTLKQIKKRADASPRTVGILSGVSKTRLKKLLSLLTVDEIFGIFQDGDDYLKSKIIANLGVRKTRQINALLHSHAKISESSTARIKRRVTKLLKTI